MRDDDSLGQSLNGRSVERTATNSRCEMRGRCEMRLPARVSPLQGRLEAEAFLAEDGAQLVL